MVDSENEGIVVNGRFIKVIYASNPNEIDYTAHGIDNAIVIDNTGKWKDEAGLGLHLQSKGVQKSYSLPQRQVISKISCLA